MVRLNINLDESQKAFIDKQIALGRYRDADEFFGDAIARVQEWDDEGRQGSPLTNEEERLLEEALDDPTPPTVLTRQLMDEMKRELVENHHKATGR